MADYRNHRRFMLKCIKASITPVSCTLKSPLKTKKSYEIIHKVEKQLLYERIRNINTLDMFENNRSQYYSQLKNMINKHDQDIEKCILFINKIKENRHNKIKVKHIDKFKWLHFKRFGYHHNLTIQVFQHPPQDSNNLTVPATSMVPTPSSSMDTGPTAPGHPPSSSRDTCKADHCTNKWVINLSKILLTQDQLSLLQKVPNFAITPKYPPIEAYITAVEQASSKLLAQEADELRSVAINYSNNSILSTKPNVISTPHNTELSHNSSRTHPAWYSQMTRGWPWSSWFNKITPARPTSYHKTPTHTKCSESTPPTASKTN